MTKPAVRERQQDADEERVDYRPEPGSLPWRIMRLELGQSISETRRIQKDELAFEDTAGVMVSMSGPISSTVTRLQQRTGRKFLIERGKALTSSDDVLCTIAVTRVE